MKVVAINTVATGASTGSIAAALARLGAAEGFETRLAWGRGRAAPGVEGMRFETPCGFFAHVARGFFGGSGFGSRRATRRLVAWLETERPDMLHLHNLHGFYLDIETLFAWIKARGIPVRWTLHDAWPLTGHCAFFEEFRCGKWRAGCGECPCHRSRYPYSLFRDASAAAWRRKAEAFAGVSDMRIITPSRWLADVVRASPILGAYPAVVHPNGVDCEVFSPEGPVAELRGWNGPVVLGAANVWEPRKGLAHLVRLARALGPECRVVALGVDAARRARLRALGPATLVALPRTTDAAALAAWMRRADVFANPTLDDNFPTTQIEALACGTPVVAFAAGGSAESIGPGCGQAVTPGDDEALLAAVAKALRERSPARRAACRAHAVACYERTARLRAMLAEWTA